MKKYIFLFLLFSIVARSVSAQPANYDGPAKIAVKSFLDNLEKATVNMQKGSFYGAAGQLDYASRSIVNIAKRDPSLDTMEMHNKVVKLTADLAAFVEADKAQHQQAKQQSKDKVKLDGMMDHLFGPTVNLQVSTSELATIESEISDYRSRVQEVIGFQKDPEVMKAYAPRIARELTVHEADIQEIESRSKGSQSADGAKCYYYELAYYQAFWDGASKLYPDHPEFLKLYQMVSGKMSSLGSIADLEKNAEKNRLKAIADRRLNKALVKDAALEKMFMDAFNKKYSEDFKGTAIKVSITTGDWLIERNDLTGIILGRSRQAALVYKGRDNKCYLVYPFSIYQDYVGSSFQAQSTRSVYVTYTGSEMLCENVQ